LQLFAKLSLSLSLFFIDNFVPFGQYYPLVGALLLYLFEVITSYIISMSEVKKRGRPRGSSDITTTQYARLYHHCCLCTFNTIFPKESTVDGSHLIGPVVYVPMH
jgi:hypothetical protein